MRSYEFIVEDRESLLLWITLRDTALHIDDLNSTVDSCNTPGDKDNLHELILKVDSFVAWYQKIAKDDADKTSLFNEYIVLLEKAKEKYRSISGLP